jgi:hypothetical protein
MCITMYINHLFDDMRPAATSCKTSNFGLKTRRDNLSWGFDPPPGTKILGNLFAKGRLDFEGPLTGTMLH